MWCTEKHDGSYVFLYSEIRWVNASFDDGLQSLGLENYSGTFFMTNPPMLWPMNTVGALN